MPGPHLDAENVEEEFVDIDGHRVRATDVDRFYNNHDGSRVTDEQWDEDRRRRESPDLVLVEISRTPPEGV